MRGEKHNTPPSTIKFLILLFILSLPDTLFSEVRFGAKLLEYLPDNKLVVLKDSAWTKDNTNKLFADSIIYFEDSALLKAYGNALLITGKDSFHGDYLYYNTKTKTGYAFEGYTLKENGKIWGQMAYKDSLDNIYIKDGFYTTCENDTPHYFFQSKYMKVIKKEMAIARPVVLRVHEVPLFAVPFWMFPIKRGRKSGFLTPHIGYNSYSGKYFKNLAYYLVINNYMDITTSFDVVENVGIRGNIDLVYKLYKRLGGEIEYSRAENFWPRKAEWSIKGWHRQRLNKNTIMQARLNYISSYDYYNQYSDTKVEWLKKELYSYVTIQHSSRFFPFTITVDDRIKPDRQTRESMIPSLQYSLPPVSFLNMRFYGGILRKRVKDSLSVKLYEGMQNTIQAGYNSTILHYLRLNTSVTTPLNILPKDTTNKNFTIQKSILIQQSISTTLYGFSVFGLSFAGIKKFIHILSPSLVLSYIPDIKNDSVTFQYGSIYTGGKHMNLTIQNTFLAKTDSGKIPLISVNLSSSYDFDNEKWGNVPVTFALSEKLPVKIRGNALYNTETGKLENPSVFISSSFKLTLPATSFNTVTTHDTDSILSQFSENSVSFNINYSFTKQSLFSSQTISLSGGFRISPTLTGSFSYSYDLAHGRHLSRTLSLKKDLHCWELTFSYNKYGDIWDYNFRVFIKKIPDIKIDRGFLKDLLP